MQLAQVSARNTSSNLRRGLFRSRAQSSIERADAANPTLREKHEPVADTFGVTELVDRKNESCAPGR